jgi:CRP-like cAMP-binding protein
MQYLNPYIELCLEGPSSIFKGLNNKDKEIISHHHNLQNIKRGSYIFKEGDKPKGLICLASGKVKLFKEGVGGRQQIVKMVRPLGFLGYRPIYTDSVQSFSAVAVEDSTVCIFDKSSISKTIKKNAELGMKLIKILSDELWFSYNRTVSLTQKHIRGRLAESLLILRDTYGYEDDGKTIRVSLSREDIANLSNMTTSNGIRTLSNMASEGIIELEGRKIRIIKSTILEHISELG